MIGTRVHAYGIVGGPYQGIVKRKGKSKDCWIVKIKHENGTVIQEIHIDYLQPKRRRPR